MKVLLAIDGSPGSDDAIREVARRPWPAGTQIRVVTVDAPLGEPTFGPGATTLTAYDELVRRLRENAHACLDAGAQMLREAAPGLDVSSALLVGSPKEEIVAEARRWGADLIAVGSQGRGAIKSLFLGSVSLGVVLNAPCSVLVVRAPANPRA